MEPYCQKFFGRSFDSKHASEWKSKLSEVHDWMWTKWSYVKKDKPFRLGKKQVEQTPGVIKDDVARSLESVVSELPPKIKYPRR